MDETIQLLTAISSETRYKLTRLLLDRELCVCELEHILNLSQPAISQQIRLLREAGLIQQRRQGRWVFYRIDSSTFRNRLDQVVQTFLSPSPESGIRKEWRRLEDILENPRDNCPVRKEGFSLS